MRIITLTLSSAYDVHCCGENVELGKENFVRLISKDAGGKGINISRTLKVFGVDSTAIAVLGSENCNEFLQMLEKDTLDVKPIYVCGRIRENITIHTESKEETRISFGGTEVPRDIIETVEKITDDLLSEGDILTFTGSIPSGVDILEAVAYLKRQREKGIKVIVDSRSLGLDALVDIKPFLIKPNEYEIGSYINSPMTDKEGAVKAANELRGYGIENVIISLGKRGAVISSSEGTFYAPASRVEVNSTIGAGDSTIAGFIYAVSRGFDSKSALEISVAFGSASCLTEGTRPPCKRDVAQMLKNGTF